VIAVSGLRHCDHLISSRGRRTAVESKPNRSCNHRISGRFWLVGENTEATDASTFSRHLRTCLPTRLHLCMAVSGDLYRPPSS